MFLRHHEETVELLDLEPTRHTSTYLHVAESKLDVVMIFREHLKFTIVIVTLLRRFGKVEIINFGDWWHIIAASILASLLPDLDHPRSWCAKQLPYLSRFVVRISAHRGFTHSAMAILLISALGLVLSLVSERCVPTDVLYSAVIGYTGHILADMFTPSGVPLLWPCSFRFSFPLTCTCGVNNSAEKFLDLCLVVTSVILFLS